MPIHSYVKLALNFFIIIPLSLFSQGSGSNHISTLESILQSIKNKEQENIQLERKIEANNLLIPGESAQIPPLEKDLLVLESEKITAYNELKNGYYCSECKRPKSEIERTDNTTFEKHLRDVNGVRIPMSQDQIDKKMAWYDSKINGLKSQIKFIKDGIIKKQNDNVDFANKIIDNKNSIANLKEKARITANDYADKRESAFKNNHAKWTSSLSYAIGKKYLAICNHKVANDKAHIFQTKSAELKIKRIEELNNLLDLKISNANDKSNQIQNEIIKDKEKRNNEIRNILSDIESLVEDSSVFSRSYQNLTNKTAADSFQFITTILEYKGKLKNLRNKFHERNRYWEEDIILKKQNEINKLKDSVWIITKERFFRVNSLENKLDEIKAKAMIAYQNAIEKANLDIKESENAISETKDRVTNEVIVFNNATSYDKSRINALMAEIGSAYYKTIPIYTEYSVVYQITDELTNIAEETINYGTLYSGYVSEDLKNSLNVAPWSRSILDACMNKNNPSFQEQEDKQIRDRIKLLEDQL